MAVTAFRRACKNFPFLSLKDALNQVARFRVTDLSTSLLRHIEEARIFIRYGDLESGQLTNSIPRMDPSSRAEYHIMSAAMRIVEAVIEVQEPSHRFSTATTLVDALQQIVFARGFNITDAETIAANHMENWDGKGQVDELHNQVCDAHHFFFDHYNTEFRNELVQVSRQVTDAARLYYVERSPSSLVALHSALAGSTSSILQRVAAHIIEDTMHPQGCFVIDLLRGEQTLLTEYENA